MKVKRREHNGYTEYANAIKQAKLKDYKLPFKCYFGQYQYIYTQGRKEISLVKLKSLGFGKRKDYWFWEIYCLKGDLFDDVIRFRTKTEAAIRIAEIFAERQAMTRGYTYSNDKVCERETERHRQLILKKRKEKEEER